MEGEYSEATQDFDASLRLKPDQADAFAGRGYTWERKGDYDRAIADSTQAIRLQADSESFYLIRGIAYEKKRDYVHAFADFATAVRLNPADPAAFVDRGLTYFKRGDHTHALQDYNQALKLKADFPQALNNRGVSYLHMGLLDRAIQDFTAALQAKPGYRFALYNRGITYRKKGDSVRAAKDLKQSGPFPLFGFDDFDLASRSHTFQIPTQGWTYIGPLRANESPGPSIGTRSSSSGKPATLGSAIQELGNRINNAGKRSYSEDPDQSIANLDKLISTDPENAFAFNARGIEYLKKGNYDRAIEDFNEAIRLRPALVDAKINLERAEKAKNTARK
jgi:tetratricopeptide (TPR) repeat protein